MQLTPEDLAKLETKQVANIIRKLNAGKSLTAREEAILSRTRTSEVQTPGQTAAAAPITSGFAKTWDELAEILSVDRRTLTNARAKFGKLCPKDKADGRKDIALWATFVEEKGIRGRGVNNQEIGLDERELRLREWKNKLERSEFELEKAKKLSLAVAEFEAALGDMLGAFRANLNRLPGRAASKIMSRAKGTLLRVLKDSLTATVYKKVELCLDRSPALDYADIEEALQREVDTVLSVLHSCEYLKADPDLT